MKLLLRMASMWLHLAYMIRIASITLCLGNGMVCGEGAIWYWTFLSVEELAGQLTRRKTPSGEELTRKEALKDVTG